MKQIKNKSRLLLGLKKSPADLKLAKLVLYYPRPTSPRSEDTHIAHTLDNCKDLLKDSKFDKSKNTILYLHGYLEDLEKESVHVIVDAYLQRTDTNIIVLDWGELADGNYMFDAYINMKQLATVLAKHLLDMFNNGLNIDKFHIVGHSLGGQMAGVIGREIRRRSKDSAQLKRISALDPAFPLFYTVGLTAHLNKKDAEFVDVIHTDAWYYGAPVSTGTADFWPNGGRTLQPGCPKRNYKALTDNDLSSHRRSWWFWAESVTNQFPDQFVAVNAKCWSDFKNGKYAETDKLKAIMGHDCPTNVSGDYYLQTNGITPYARGEAGIVYVDPKELIGNTYVDPESPKPK